MIGVVTFDSSWLKKQDSNGHLHHKLYIGVDESCIVCSTCSIVFSHKSSMLRMTAPKIQVRLELNSNQFQLSLIQTADKYFERSVKHLSLSCPKYDRSTTELVWALKATDSDFLQLHVRISTEFFGRSSEQQNRTDHTPGPCRVLSTP